MIYLWEIEKRTSTGLSARKARAARINPTYVTSSVALTMWARSSLSTADIPGPTRNGSAVIQRASLITPPRSGIRNTPLDRVFSLEPLWWGRQQTALIKESLPVGPDCCCPTPCGSASHAPVSSSHTSTDRHIASLLMSIPQNISIELILMNPTLL